MQGDRAQSLAGALAAWVLLATAAEPAAAVMEPFARGLRLGPVDIHLGLESRTVYETNVFRSNTAEYADVSQRTRPSVLLGYDSLRTVLELEGFFEHEQYFGVETAATERQTSRSWGLGLNADQKLAGGTRLGVSGRYKQTSDPILSEITLRNDRLQRERTEVEGRLGQVAGVGLVEFETKYVLALDDYESGFAVYDRDTHALNLKATLRPYPTLGLFSELGYQRTHRPNPGAAFAPDADTVKAVVGASGSLSPLYQLRLGVGATYKAFAGERDRVRPTVAASFSYLPDGLTTLNAQYQYENLDGTISDEILVQRGIVEVSRKLGRRLTFAVKGAYWESEYFTASERDRIDFNRQIRGRLGIQPPGAEMVDIGLSYEYLDRSSDIDLFEFTDHIGTLEVALRY